MEKKLSENDTLTVSVKHLQYQRESLVQTNIIENLQNITALQQRILNDQTTPENE
jgi:hypothetical protein